ncbi:MAG: hypothetical protein ABSE48_00375 [Verrucomicrobiota bacterium]|jgi:hypothetical protein
MNEILQKWLADRANAPGTLGAGIYSPDGSSVCHSMDEQFAATQIEKVLHQLAQSQPQLPEAGLTPRWSTWVFEQGKIRCVLRADGLLFGLAVRTDTDAAQNLNQLSRDFLALQLDAGSGGGREQGPLAA